MPCRSNEISVEETPEGGVIISALEVIEAGFGVVVVAAVAEGVQVCDGEVLALGFGDAEDIAPGVVGIFRDSLVGTVEDFHHIALAVDHIVIGTVGSLGLVQIATHGQRVAGFVVGEVQAADISTRAGIRHIVPDNTAILRHILMLQALGDLYAAHTGHVVLVAVGLVALGDAAEPPALRPGQVRVVRAVEPGQGVAVVAVLDVARHIIDRQA